MIKIINLILDVFCIAGVMICAIGLVIYVAAAAAVANAGDISSHMDKWLHRR